MKYFALTLTFINSFLFISTPAQADTWWDYMQIECKPDEAVFKLNDVRIFDGSNVKELVGDLVKKTEGVTYGASTDNILAADKNIGPELATCNIKAFDQITNFSVRRTSIDGGRVQGQCGAANSAEITLYANDKPITIYPSAKTDCFSGTKIEHHPRVEFKGGQIEICEAMKLRNFRSKNLRLEQTGEICRTGYIEAHEERQKKYKIYTEDNNPKSINEELSPLSAISTRHYLRQLTVENRENFKKLQDAEKKIKEQDHKISDFEAKLGEARQAKDLLQVKLDNPEKKSFRKKFRELFKRD